MRPWVPRQFCSELGSVDSLVHLWPPAPVSQLGCCAHRAELSPPSGALAGATGAAGMVSRGLSSSSPIHSKGAEEPLWPKCRIGIPSFPAQSIVRASDKTSLGSRGREIHSTLDERCCKITVQRIQGWARIRVVFAINIPHAPLARHLVQIPVSLNSSVSLVLPGPSTALATYPLVSSRWHASRSLLPGHP